MKRLILLAVLLLVGFYVVWPLLSLWQIQGAISANKPQVLAGKIDFDGVRDTLKPVIATKVAETVDRYSKQAGGAGGAILGQLKGDLVPKMTDLVTKTLVTPENVIRIAREGGSMGEKVERIISEQLGKAGGGLGGLGSVLGGGSGGQGGGLNIPGGLGGAGALGGIIGGVLGNKSGSPVRNVEEPPAAKAPAPAATEAPPSYGLANIKRFGFAGPLAFEVGVAKDPKATEADLTARISFVDLDWKVTGLTPKL